MFPCQQLLPLACPSVPWVHAWGALNLNNLTDSNPWPWMNDVAALGIGSAAIANTPFPAVGGTLDYMIFVFRAATIATDLTVTLQVDNANVAYAFTVPAGQFSGRIHTPFLIAAAAAPRLLRIRFTTPVAPGAGSTRPAVLVGGRVNL